MINNTTINFLSLSDKASVDRQKPDSVNTNVFNFEIPIFGIVIFLINEAILHLCKNIILKYNILLMQM